MSKESQRGVTMHRMIVIPMLDHVSEKEAHELAEEIQQFFGFHFEPKVVINVSDDDYKLYTDDRVVI
jgi:hypothetical protein